MAGENNTTKNNDADDVLNGGASGTGPGNSGNNTQQQKKEETVQVPKSTLEEIMRALEDNKKEISDLKKGREEDAELLRAVGDKARLQKWDESRKGKLISTAKVAHWEGEPIVGWKMVKDEVGFRDGKLHVKQEIQIFTQSEPDAEVKQTVLEYIFWAQNVEMQTGELVEKSETDEGQFWTLRMKDGRKVRLDIRFLNAF